MQNTPKTYLEACEAALRLSERPMTSRELAVFITKHTLGELAGQTPWKTINARISAEILEHGEESKFVRIDKGLFALREWSNLPAYKAPRRVINPTAETIAVVPRSKFLTFINKRPSSKFYDLDYAGLFASAHGMKRLDAEETDEVVQIIPLFFVHNEHSYLTYKRTKRLPEQRLHGTRSINFGGHLQVSDFPSLFASDNETVSIAMQRELREELNFQPDDKRVEFFGAIHDDTNLFGRQHVGLVFEVTIAGSVMAATNEPGFLTSIEFMARDVIYQSSAEFDDWTFLVLEEHFGG